ncbi:hypothetical protein HYU07_07885 [Candidatus Woesearchaeota archaeon]|nr:hypothetical protein [Candidatus Woesearchaeota archaeon]
MKEKLNLVDKIMLGLGNASYNALEVTGIALIVKGYPTAGTFILIAGGGLDLVTAMGYSDVPKKELPLYSRMKYSIPPYAWIRKINNKITEYLFSPS